MLRTPRVGQDRARAEVDAVERIGQRLASSNWRRGADRDAIAFMLWAELMDGGDIFSGSEIKIASHHIILDGAKKTAPNCRDHHLI
jgi:hypothetical protein